MAGKPLVFLNVDDTVVDVNAVPSFVDGGIAFNNTAAQAFLQFFDKKAADVTLGTTVPDWIVAVSPNDNDPIHVGESGLIFSTAVSVACTTTATGLTASDCHVAISIA